MRFSLSSRRGLRLATLTLTLCAAAAPAAAAPPHLRGTGAAPSAQAAAAAHSAAAGFVDGGITPAGLRGAYGLPTRGAAHQTIGILTAFDAPSAASDLAAYDARFGLPACTEANGCLRIVNQQGKPSPRPYQDTSGGQWVTETSVGLQAAHAVCPSCSLLLVEANTPNKSDLTFGVRTAQALGATTIVTAATPSEDATDQSFAEAGFGALHVPLVAAAGDAQGDGPGYTGSLYFPASLTTSIAVGGTSLSLSRSGGYGRESTWLGTVSGCSLFHAAPAWQAADAAKVGCQTHRTVADLAAMADPGLLVHITGVPTPGGPWYVASGTSVSAPIIAGMIGLAGAQGAGEAQMLYRHAGNWRAPSAFHDIVSGANGNPCASLLCKAGPGFDASTGIGTPDGLAAFLADGGAVNRRHPAVSLSAPARLSRSWATRVQLGNGNPFAVLGTLTLNARYRSGRHTRTLKLSSARFSTTSLAGARINLTVSRSARAAVHGLRRVTVYADVAVRGPGGSAVRFSRRIGTLAAP